MAVAGLSNACDLSVGAVMAARGGDRRRWLEWMVLGGQVHATLITRVVSSPGHPVPRCRRRGLPKRLASTR